GRQDELIYRGVEPMPRHDRQPVVRAVRRKKAKKGIQLGHRRPQLDLLDGERLKSGSEHGPHRLFAADLERGTHDARNLEPRSVLEANGSEKSLLKQHEASVFK